MDLQVGDRVRLTEYGMRKFMYGTYNSEEGRVVSIVQSRVHPYRVQWDRGYNNIYTYKELDLIEPDINEEELYY